MVKAVLITKIDPTYDDLPEERYHVPRTHVRQIEAVVGDWILYCEPRRRSGDLASIGGRQAYFATARLTNVVFDPSLHDHFYALVAGAPSALADLKHHLADSYHPLDDVAAESPMDRYAAVKALRFRSDLRRESVPALEDALDSEREIRVALETAGSAAALGSNKGQDRIADLLWSEAFTEMSMEAILILTELKTDFARDLLREAARSANFSGDERRQAAIWGLGKSGLKSYADLLPFIADPEENVAYHAIAGFDAHTPKPVIDELVAMLVGGDKRVSAAASEVLRVIDSPVALDALIEALQGKAGNTVWALATIGRLSPGKVRERLKGTPVLDRLEPMLLLAPGANWLADEEALTDLTFLLKQKL